jgi:hypothetical protein
MLYAVGDSRALRCRSVLSARLFCQCSIDEVAGMSSMGIELRYYQSALPVNIRRSRFFPILKQENPIVNT